MGRKAVPVPALFVTSGILTYVGAALAAGLFAIMSPTGVTWWRVAVGVAVLLVLWRPWKQLWTPRKILVATVFGVVLVGMNTLFYEAIARIPMGVAVAVEFLGPVAVALFRGRGWAPRVAALLALAGIVAIGGWGLDLSDPNAAAGFWFALAAGGSWALYILLGSRISQNAQTGPSLALGLAIAALLYLPFMHQAAFDVDFSWQTFLALAGVAILSTALPYSIDAIAFGRIKESTFALLTALLPATSVVVGALMLAQIPGVFEVLGVALVSVAVWLAGRGGAGEDRGGSPSNSMV